VGASTGWSGIRTSRSTIWPGPALYELTQLVGETRQLIAAPSRITKEFERDPAGLLIGSRRGFEGAAWPCCRVSRSARAPQRSIWRAPPRRGSTS
jgi:hypothetical protein